MDSITQAVLGAAMGEATTGKRLKNKALVWGAMAGTLPDLDVFSRLFVSHPVDGLIYHRGITHSIIFTLLAPLLFAYLAQKYYDKSWHKITWWRAVLTAFSGLAYAALALLIFTGNIYFYNQWWFYPLSALALWGGFSLFRHLGSEWRNRRNIEVDNPSYGQWYQLFFWAIFTHWLIDACTGYGTQIFEPFSDYRVAFNNIFIVDPLYTLPLILGCVGASWAKNLKQRQFWNYLGLGLSSLYMAWSFYAKSLASTAVAQSLAQQNISYQDYLTYPSPANTILWNITVMAEDKYYFGTYSILDQDTKIQFHPLPKNHELLQPYEQERYVKILKWFAQDYYNIIPLPDGRLRFNNLRFGLLGEPQPEQEPAYVFSYVLENKEQTLEVRQSREIENRPLNRDLAAFWTRLKGR